MRTVLRCCSRLTLKGDSDFDRSMLGSEASKMAISEIILLGLKFVVEVIVLNDIRKNQNKELI